MILTGKTRKRVNDNRSRYPHCESSRSISLFGGWTYIFCFFCFFLSIFFLFSSIFYVEDTSLSLIVTVNNGKNATHSPYAPYIYRTYGRINIWPILPCFFRCCTEFRSFLTSPYVYSLTAHGKIRLKWLLYWIWIKASWHFTIYCPYNISHSFGYPLVISLS